MRSDRIIIVDDDASDVFILRRALADTGEQFELEVLSDGEQALEFIQRYRDWDGTEPCVMLLDVHLPKFSGVEVLRALRAEPNLRALPVVAVSSGASPADQAELRRLGAEYRNKPTGLDEVAGLAAHLLKICGAMTIRG